MHGLHGEWWSICVDEIAGRWRRNWWSGAARHWWRKEGKVAMRNARWGGLRRKPVNEEVKQRSNQWDRSVRLEHRQKLREFWLVALLPLRLVTGDISLLYLIVLGRSGGPMPLRSWFCFWEERKYESLCCRGFYVKYKTTDFGLWGVLYVFVWIEVASVEARRVGSQL